MHDGRAVNTFRLLHWRNVHYAIGSADNRQSTYHGVTVLVVGQVSLTAAGLHRQTRRVSMFIESYVGLTPYRAVFACLALLLGLLVTILFYIPFVSSLYAQCMLLFVGVFPMCVCVVRISPMCACAVGTGSMCVCR